MTIAEILLAAAALCKAPGPYFTPAEIRQMPAPKMTQVLRDDSGRLYMALGYDRSDFKPLGLRCDDVVDKTILGTPPRR